MDMVAILIRWPRSLEQTFIPPSNRGSILNLVSISPAVLKDKRIKQIDLSNPGQRSINDFGLGYLKNIIQLIANINFAAIDYNSFRKIHCLPFPHTHAKVTEFDLAVN